MKTVLFLFVVSIFSAVSIGCLQQKEQTEQKQVEAPPVDPNNTSVFKFNLDYNSVFVMKIDGKEYIVVVGHNRLAICPK